MSSQSKTFISFLLFIFSTAFAFSREENFLLIDGKSGHNLIEMGPHIDERVTPCSTFKIFLSLIGFDSGILKTENDPVWPFQEGYDDFLDAWKNSQTPKSWLKTSCVWFSKELTTSLGDEALKSYLKALDYGNQDISGGLTNAWLSSSLKISTREQASFIQKMLQKEHPISSYAVFMTKQLLFQEVLPQGWKLFGKTGWSGSMNKLDGNDEIGWVVGWIEKEHILLPFAYQIREDKINLSQRIPRVKQLLIESSAYQQQFNRY